VTCSDSIFEFFSSFFPPSHGHLSHSEIEYKTIDSIFYHPYGANNVYKYF
jgi:hypothetical protein